MRTIIKNIHSQPSRTSNNHYFPSVPLSIYRELVAELQTTQGKLEALIIRNHKITEENKILRQEIDKVIRLGFQLQQRINIHQQNKSSNNPESFPRQWQEKPSTQKSPKPPTKKIHNIPTAKPQEYDYSSDFISPIIRKTVLSSKPLTVEDQKFSHYSTSSKNDTISNWRLFFCVLLIVIAGFSAGYIIVRPLFQINYR